MYIVQVVLYALHVIRIPPDLPEVHHIELTSRYCITKAPGCTSLAVKHPTFP